ncbi:hypothetical protein [Rhodocyclus gracilis]|nr:hypothetical protein [Rhodocyclus gracilis]
MCYAFREVSLLASGFAGVGSVLADGRRGDTPRAEGEVTGCHDT